MLLKNKYFISLFVVSVLAFISITCVLSKNNSNKANKTTSPLYQKTLLKIVYNDTVDANRLQKFVSLFDTQTGIWTDIDYTDDARTNWDPIAHLARIRYLAIDYSKNQNKKYLEVINLGLEKWFQEDYTCPNWFVNDITAKNHLVDILVAVGTNITPSNYNNILKKLDALYPEKRTYVNRVYLATIQLKYALYFNDTTLINNAKELINNEIYISNDVEGLQADYTYRFHKARIQEYAYGKGFLESCVDVFELLNQTPYRFSDNKIAILRNFILESWQWLARGSYTVPSTMDRSSSRKGALKAPQIIETLERFKKIDTLYVLDYQKIIEQQNNIKNFNLVGVKSFPYSDIAVAHSSNASFFLKVLSDRNLPTESINSENLLGKFLHFGNHFIIKDAIEYSNILGAFDWNLLPGFSYIEGTDNISRTSNTGVAKFGNMIVANMTFDYLDKNKSKITQLNKTWIVQQDKLICLIAAPKNTLNKPITTSLNQTRFRNGVFINNQKMALQKSTVTLNNGDYLYHDNLIYCSPNANTIQYTIENRANDWGTISKSYKKEKNIDSLAIFTATINQQNQATSYAIVYAKTAAENPYKSNLYSIVYNNNDIQMIYLNNEDAYCGTIFNPNQEIKIPSLKKVIKVTKPILFIYKNNTIFVTEPSLTSSAINLKIKRKTYKIILDKYGQGNIKIN